MAKDNSGLRDKIVVIAGATGLIGRELCNRFIRECRTVIITSRDKTKGKTLEDELNAFKKGKAVFCKLDISSEENVDRLITQALAAYSTIDVFINCSWPRTDDWMTNVEDVSFDSIKQNIVNHLGGYFLCTQRMAKTMKKQGSGSIINFSSIYGLVGPDFSIYENTAMTCPPVYPLVKGGIVAMTKYFATYFAEYNVRVNCICPGGIFNNQDEKFVKKYIEKVPMGRMGRPDDIAGAAVFLASDESSYITGHCLTIDGGWTAW